MSLMGNALGIAYYLVVFAGTWLCILSNAKNLYTLLGKVKLVVNGSLCTRRGSGL